MPGDNAGGPPIPDRSCRSARAAAREWPANEKLVYGLERDRARSQGSHPVGRPLARPALGGGRGIAGHRTVMSTPLTTQQLLTLRVTPAPSAQLLEAAPAGKNHGGRRGAGTGARPAHVKKAKRTSNAKAGKPHLGTMTVRDPAP